MGYLFLFRKKNFLLLLSTHVLSQLAIYIMNYLLLVQIFQYTGSSIATSLLWVSYAIPAILVGPVASASVDFLEYRKVLVTTNILQSLIIFLYGLLYMNSLYLLFFVAMSYSLLNQFYVPAELSSVPAMVDKKNLSFANSVFFITQQGSIILGFLGASVMKSSFGFVNSIYLCSLFLFFAFISTLFLPSNSVKRKRKFDKIEVVIFGFFKEILLGYNFIRKERNVSFPFLLLLGIQIIISVLVVNAPNISRDFLRINLDLAGIIMVVPASVGAISGGLLIPKLMKSGMRKIKIIKLSLFISAMAFLGFSLLIKMLPYINSLALSMLLLYFLGAAFMGISVPAQTFLQEKTPGGYRGRVFGNFWFLVTILSVFPVILSGFITDILGIQSLMLIIALAFIFSLVAINKKVKLTNNISHIV